MASKKKVGRPLMYESAEEMQTVIDKYFLDCEGTILEVDGKAMTDKYGNPVYVGRRPPTVTGLALALGFISRQSLLNYEARSDDFYDTITRAKARVEQYAEERLFDKDGANGAKFSLANNFKGWNEKQQLEVSTLEQEKTKLNSLLQQISGDGSE